MTLCCQGIYTDLEEEKTSNVQKIKHPTWGRQVDTKKDFSPTFLFLLKNKYPMPFVLNGKRLPIHILWEIISNAFVTSGIFK